VTEAMFMVLIVEDDAGIRSVLRTLLESQHYRVVEAGNATRGVIEARTHRPDLAIVDLGLPDRDGVALIREVRRFSPLPILVLSARTMWPSPSVRRNCWRGCAQGCVAMRRAASSCRHCVSGPSAWTCARAAAAGRQAPCISRRSNTACSIAWHATPA
jgi:CheY-like chemotaxis protein